MRHECRYRKQASIWEKGPQDPSFTQRDRCRAESADYTAGRILQSSPVPGYDRNRHCLCTWRLSARHRGRVSDQYHRRHPGPGQPVLLLNQRPDRFRGRLSGAEGLSEASARHYPYNTGSDSDRRRHRLGPDLAAERKILWPGCFPGSDPEHIPDRDAEPVPVTARGRSPGRCA